MVKVYAVTHRYDFGSCHPEGDVEHLTRSYQSAVDHLKSDANNLTKGQVEVMEKLLIRDVGGPEPLVNREFHHGDEEANLTLDDAEEINESVDYLNGIYCLERLTLND